MNDTRINNIGRWEIDINEATMMTAMQTLELAVEQIRQSNDRCVVLLSCGLPSLWAAVVTMLKATLSADATRSVEACDVEPEQVQYVLNGKRFLMHYMELCNSCMELYDKALMLHDNIGDNKVESAMAATMEAEYGEGFKARTLEMGNSVPVSIADVHEQKTDALMLMHDALLYNHQLVQQIIMSGHEILKPFDVTYKDLLMALITGFRKYVAKHHRRIEKLLRHQTNQFRPKRTSPLTPEVWGALYEVEEKAIDAAISEVLIRNEKFCYIDGTEQLLMQENRDLLARIMLNCIDEEIYNFKDAIENNDLLENLTGENLPYFYERVHRRNLIQIGMFPQLKEEYDEFLKGNGHPWERSNENQNENENCHAEGREPAVLFTPEAMKLWDKLQEAELIDEDFQPMLSMRKASVIASVMGGRLGLSPLWEPFEKLWDANNLANSYSQAQISKYYGYLMKDVKNALK